MKLMITLFVSFIVVLVFCSSNKEFFVFYFSRPPHSHFLIFSFSQFFFLSFSGRHVIANNHSLVVKLIECLDKNTIREQRTRINTLSVPLLNECCVRPGESGGWDNIQTWHEFFKEPKCCNPCVIEELHQQP